ncbi:hypothetical protein ATO7_12158 [Oceanococcus atlanticus]|uniref:UPF0125 protein ATO7_12158 n=1 Tax=Oceanococcus atlanticus TaxID=1317117 RepID=A0A1Y1SBM7_9GAMM|nr:RnfH family protein [Oceanococcus atlanticus]ORE86047.1 hypothetical protein ATO7_12158 [Oceanococcus atlanticus]RZO86139.1 MAG: RnfH family protein [Oceanococcus sp.]
MSIETTGDLIAVEVAYATPEKQHLLSLNVPQGSTVEEAVRRSGILDLCPEIDLTVNKVGVWGKIGKLGQTLEARDRAEIYRALKADPKEARRKRAREA